MTGISASTINAKRNDIPNTPPIPKKTEKDQSNDIKDKVDIKGGFKKVAKFVLGAGTAVVIAPINCISRGYEGAVEAGLKGTDVNKSPGSLGSRLKALAIMTAPIGGAILGMPLGIPGMLLGAVEG